MRDSTTFKQNDWVSSCTNSALEMLAKRSEQRQGVIWECCLALPRWKHAVFDSRVSNKEKSNRSLAPTHSHSSISTQGPVFPSYCSGSWPSWNWHLLFLFNGPHKPGYQGFHLFSLLSWQDSGCGLLFFLILPISLGTLRTEGNWNCSRNLNSFLCQRLNNFF